GAPFESLSGPACACQSALAFARSERSGVNPVERNRSTMSGLLLSSRRRLPAIVPPLLSFTAGFIDSFTVLALFGLFVAQVTGTFVLKARGRCRLSLSSLKAA